MRGSFFVPHDLTAPVAGAHGGPLAGLTAAVKDMYDIVGARTGGGSPEWLAAQQPATAHAAAVANILDAGATVIGKTVCDEFFYSITGENAHYGTPPNVRAPGRVPGGSSAGSAAAVAAGICDFALGSDTGGSIRVPASFCGSTDFARRTAASISPARWACRPRSMSPAGLRAARAYSAAWVKSCLRAKAPARPSIR
jgi:amidase